MESLKRKADEDDEDILNDALLDSKLPKIEYIIYFFQSLF